MRLNSNMILCNVNCNLFIKQFAINPNTNNIIIIYTKLVFILLINILANNYVSKYARNYKLICKFNVLILTCFKSRGIMLRM